MSHLYQFIQYPTTGVGPFNLISEAQVSNSTHYGWQVNTTDKYHWGCYAPVSKNLATGDISQELWGTYIWDDEPFELSLHNIIVVIPEPTSPGEQLLHDAIDVAHAVDMELDPGLVYVRIY